VRQWTQARGFAHLAATVPSRPAGDLHDDQLLAKAKGSSHWNLTVVDVGQSAPLMLRILMSAHEIETMEWHPAQDLTVLITRAAGRDIRRRYTIASHEHDRIHIDVYLHGKGIGTAWARTCRPGHSVSAIGPRGKFLLQPDADWHVMIGDETSLPGIKAMLAATDRPAQVVVDVDDPSDWRRSRSCSLRVQALPTRRLARAIWLTSSRLSSLSLFSAGAQRPAGRAPLR
jgi:NADPH-dependent ferric siderophore reductase